MVVNAGEPEIGDGVEGAKGTQNREAHLVGLDLPLACGPQGLLDLLPQLREIRLENHFTEKLRKIIHSSGGAA